MADEFDPAAMVERFRERAKAVKNRGMPPIEGAERRIPSTTGKLSDDTLKELLLAQEQESAPVGGVAPAAKSEP